MYTFVCVLVLVALLFSANVIFSVNSHIEKAVKQLIKEVRHVYWMIRNLNDELEMIRSDIDRISDMVTDISDAIVNEMSGDVAYTDMQLGWSSDDESGDAIEWKDTCDETYQPKLPGFDDNESIVVWTNDSVDGVKTEYYKR